MSKWLRGMVSEKIQMLCKDFLGREVTTRELRLFPYIDYCLKNWGVLDRSKVNKEEMEILNSYDEELIKIENGEITYISNDFYNFIQKVLWEAYIHPTIKEK